MNTNPDDERLAMWLDDELRGTELTSFEASLAGRDDLFALREETRLVRAVLAAALPASEEPPHPEFFNHRILHEISKERPAAIAPRKAGWWSRTSRFAMPLAACAGMVAAFLLGAKSQRTSVAPAVIVEGAPRAIPVESFVYTPDQGVDAEWFTSDPASAVVLVLNGVEAIPDSTNLRETAMMPDGSPEHTVENGEGGGF
ncbi:MAG: hypothetical protein V4733_06165 [Verrucomicrobiota bacterium]